MKLSLAVAASAAVPGAFAPVVLDQLTFPARPTRLRCSTAAHTTTPGSGTRRRCVSTDVPCCAQCGRAVARWSVREGAAGTRLSSRKLIALSPEHHIAHPRDGWAVRAWQLAGPGPLPKAPAGASCSLWQQTSQSRRPASWPSGASDFPNTAHIRVRTSRWCPLCSTSSTQFCAADSYTGAGGSRVPRWQPINRPGCRHSARSKRRHCDGSQFSVDVANSGSDNEVGWLPG